VFLAHVSTTIASERIPDIQTQADNITRRQLQEWFAWMDQILDIHRSNFVFRQPKPEQLQQHKTLLKRAIEYSRFISALVTAPDFNEPELTARLRVRIQQLQDANDTFDEALSDKQAEQLLASVFP